MPADISASIARIAVGLLTPSTVMVDATVTIGWLGNSSNSLTAQRRIAQLLTTDSQPIAV
jgi:hypothetical protein